MQVEMQTCGIMCIHLYCLNVVVVVVVLSLFSLFLHEIVTTLMSLLSLHICDLISLISSHLFFNREGRWGTTDDFATSFLHVSLFSTALWDLPNSRPVHSLMLSSHLFFCLPCLLPPFIVPCKMGLARPDERET